MSAIQQLEHEIATLKEKRSAAISERDQCQSALDALRNEVSSKLRELETARYVGEIDSAEAEQRRRELVESTTTAERELERWQSVVGGLGERLEEAGDKLRAKRLERPTRAYAEAGERRAEAEEALRVAEAELESARQKLFEAEEHARDEWRATRVDPAIIETLRLQDARDEELLRQVSVGRHALPDDVVPPRLQARLRERKAQLQATIQGGVNGQGDD